MAKVILTADGQEFDIEDEIAKDDDLLKSVLKSFAPQLGDPELKRESKDGVLTVRVTKRAGPKGSAVIEALAAAESYENPSVIVNRKIDLLRECPFGPKAFVARVMKMEGDIISALQTAKSDAEATSSAVKALYSATGEHASYVPVGF